MRFPDPLSHVFVSTALERRLWAMCSAVSGVVYRSLDVAAGDGVRDIALGMEGWSPTLHACTIAATTKCDPELPGFDDAVTALCEDVLTRQRLREADALRLGIGLPAGTSVVHPLGDHLHADASALAAAIVEQGRTSGSCPDCGRDCYCGEVGEPTPDDMIVGEVLRSAAGSLRLAHGGDRAYDGGRTIMSSGCCGYERRVHGGGVMRCVDLQGRRVGTIPGGEMRINTSKGSTTLSLPVEGFPETIIAALPGRTVGEVVAGEGDAWLSVAKRRITSVTTRGTSLNLGLAPVMAAFADLRDMTPGKALAHLRGIVDTSN